MASPFEQAARALDYARGTYEALERPETATTLFAAAEAIALPLWRAAGLQTAGAPTHAHRCQVQGEVALFETWRSAELATLEGDSALRLTLWLSLTTHANRSVDAVIELWATEFIGSREGQRCEMQLSRVWGKVNADGSSSWASIEKALLDEMAKRVSGKRPMVPFAQMLQHVADESLDWLVP